MDGPFTVIGSGMLNLPPLEFPASPPQAEPAAPAAEDDVAPNFTAS